MMGDIQASGIQRRMREFRPISSLKSHKQRCRKFTCVAILISCPSPPPKQPRPPSDPSFAVTAHFSAKRPFCGFSATFPDRATRGVTLTNGEVGLWNCGDVPCFPPNLRAKSGMDHGMAWHGGSFCRSYLPCLVCLLFFFSSVRRLELFLSDFISPV